MHLLTMILLPDCNLIICSISLVVVGGYPWNGPYSSKEKWPTKNRGKTTIVSTDGKKKEEFYLLSRAKQPCYTGLKITTGQ